MAIRIKKATEHSEMNMTVRAYIEKIELGEITFDIDIQRAYVWKDEEQKSGLIQSLIINDISRSGIPYNDEPASEIRSVSLSQVQHPQR